MGRSPNKTTKHQKRLWRQGKRKRQAAEKAKKERWRAEKERAAAKKKQVIERLRRILGLSPDEWPTIELEKWHKKMWRQDYFPSVDEYFRHWFCNQLGRVAHHAASIARLMHLRSTYRYWSERTNGEVKSHYDGLYAETNLIMMDSMQKFLNPITRIEIDSEG